MWHGTEWCSADANGNRQVVYLNRNGENRKFNRNWSHPSNQWNDGSQFLGVRMSLTGNSLGLNRGSF